MNRESRPIAFFASIAALFALTVAGCGGEEPKTPDATKTTLFSQEALEEMTPFDYYVETGETETLARCFADALEVQGIVSMVEFEELDPASERSEAISSAFDVCIAAG